MKRKIAIIIITSVVVLSVLLGVFVAWLGFENRSIVITEYKVESEHIPEEFHGFRIVQISDLHNDEFGRDNSRLLKRISESDPDIIVLTGDLVDSRRTDVDVAISFAESAATIAPTYYVTGNHEHRIPEDYERLKAGLVEVGVTVMENESVLLEKNGDKISLVGLHDPSFFNHGEETFSENVVAEKLTHLTDETSYDIVLAHRPQYFETYAKSNADLILSGHVHGGQFRLPFVGGLYAPSQGLFPKYDEGKCEDNGTVMIVSRGVGNSIVPIRLGNRSEIETIVLDAGK
jgi:predicted MPP superfamily phosphohydrolase